MKPNPLTREDLYNQFLEIKKLNPRFKQIDICKALSMPGAAVEPPAMSLLLKYGLQIDTLGHRVKRYLDDKRKELREAK